MVPGNAGPRMAGDVKGEGDRESDAQANLFQRFVGLVQFVPVFISIVLVFEDGQQEGTFFLAGVFVDDFLHAMFPSDV